ncbi:MAG TPA: RhuM family protein [Steroidobacteraceae bacterium]|nr:RhuM family protein [Steroidobacteraceae bacterium]
MAKALGGEIVVYEDSGGEVRVDVRLEHETVWLSLGQLAELFGRDKSVISRHLRNVFASGELERTATGAKNAPVQREGDREVAREIEFFNLDAILSVGYRVNSKRGTQFRIWGGADRLSRFSESILEFAVLARLRGAGYAVCWHSARESVP